MREGRVRPLFKCELAAVTPDALIVVKELPKLWCLVSVDVANELVDPVKVQGGWSG